MLPFIFQKNFPTLAALTAVSDITSATMRCMKPTSRILQFFSYGYFEDLLAPISFAQNFGFLACVVSKIFTIKSTFATNSVVNQRHCNPIIKIITIKKSIFA